MIFASIQHTIIEILMDKLKLAVQETGITNRYWRRSFSKFWNSKHLKRNRKKYGWKTFIPKFEYTTDNAAMIGSGVSKVLSQQFETSSVVSKARIQI
jgi:N6-L-threonylcarbamoyladenine synthase